MNDKMGIQSVARLSAHEISANLKIKRSLVARPRRDRVNDVKAGDSVFVWRKAVGRNNSRKYYHWSGLGVVIGTEGRSAVWVDLHGYLVKAPPEAIRPATEE